MSTTKKIDHYFQRELEQTAKERKVEKKLRFKNLVKLQLYKNFSPTTPLSDKFLDIVGTSRATFNHDFKLRPKIVHTNYFKYSFFNRYISDWNFLPGDVVNSPSLQSFKTSSLEY